MLRRNGDEREPDRILVAADLNGDSEDLIKWTLTRSQPGDVLFLLHVIGPANSHGSREAVSGTNQEGDALLRERIRALAQLLGRLKSICENLKVMTSMRIVQRADLGPAIAREAASLQATRVVIGSTGWFMQQRMEGSAAAWSTLLSFIGSCVPSECLIMMVDDGRLAAVKRGSLSAGKTIQGPKEELETKKVAPRTESRDVSPMLIRPHLRDPGDFARVGPRGPRLDPSIAVVAPDDDMAGVRCLGGTLSDTRSRRSMSAGKERLPSLHERRFSSPPLRRPGWMGDVPRAITGSPHRRMSPMRWGSPPADGARGAKVPRSSTGDKPPQASLFRGAPTRRRASPSHAMLERLEMRRAGSPVEQYQQHGGERRSPIPRWASESPPSAGGGRRSLDSGLHGGLPTPGGSPGGVPARFGSPKRGLRLDPFSLRLVSPPSPQHAVDDMQVRAAGQLSGSPGRGLALSPFSLRLSPDRAANASADRSANGSAGSRRSSSPVRRSPLHAGALLRRRSSSPSPSPVKEAAVITGERHRETARSPSPPVPHSPEEQAAGVEEAAARRGNSGARGEVQQHDQGAAHAVDSSASPSPTGPARASPRSVSPRTGASLATWGLKVRNSRSPGDTGGMPGSRSPTLALEEEDRSPEHLALPPGANTWEGYRGASQRQSPASPPDKQEVMNAQGETPVPFRAGRREEPSMAVPHSRLFLSPESSQGTDSPGAGDAAGVPEEKAAGAARPGEAESIPQAASQEEPRAEVVGRRKDARPGEESHPSSVGDRASQERDLQGRAPSPEPVPGPAREEALSGYAQQQGVQQVDPLGSAREAMEPPGGYEIEAGQQREAGESQESAVQQREGPLGSARAAEEGRPSPPAGREGGCPSFPLVHQGRPWGDRGSKGSPRGSPLRRALFHLNGLGARKGQAQGTISQAAGPENVPPAAFPSSQAGWHGDQPGYHVDQAVPRKGFLGRRRFPSPEFRASPRFEPPVPQRPAAAEAPPVLGRRRGKILSSLSRALSPSQRRQEAPAVSQGPGSLAHPLPHAHPYPPQPLQQYPAQAYPSSQQLSGQECPPQQFPSQKFPGQGEEAGVQVHVQHVLGMQFYSSARQHQGTPERYPRAVELYPGMGDRRDVPGSQAGGHVDQAGPYLVAQERALPRKGFLGRRRFPSPEFRATPKFEPLAPHQAAAAEAPPVLGRRRAKILSSLSRALSPSQRRQEAPAVNQGPELLTHPLPNTGQYPLHPLQQYPSQAYPPSQQLPGQQQYPSQKYPGQEDEAGGQVQVQQVLGMQFYSAARQHHGTPERYHGAVGLYPGGGYRRDIPRTPTAPGAWAPQAGVPQDPSAATRGPPDGSVPRSMSVDSSPAESVEGEALGGSRRKGDRRRRVASLFVASPRKMASALTSAKVDSVRSVSLDSNSNSSAAMAQVGEGGPPVIIPETIAEDPAEGSPKNGMTAAAAAAAAGGLPGAGRNGLPGVGRNGGAIAPAVSTPDTSGRSPEEYKGASPGSRFRVKMGRGSRSGRRERAKAGRKSPGAADAQSYYGSAGAAGTRAVPLSAAAAVHYYGTSNKYNGYAGDGSGALTHADADDGEGGSRTARPGEESHWGPPEQSQQEDGQVLSDTNPFRAAGNPGGTPVPLTEREWSASQGSPPQPAWDPAQAPAELAPGFGKRALVGEFERSGELHVLQERGSQVEAQGRGGSTKAQARKGQMEGSPEGVLGEMEQHLVPGQNGVVIMQEKQQSPLSAAVGGENQNPLALHAAGSFVSVDSTTDGKENYGDSLSLSQSASEGEPPAYRPPGQLAWNGGGARKSRRRKSRPLNPFLQDLPDEDVDAAELGPSSPTEEAAAPHLREPHPFPGGPFWSETVPLSGMATLQMGEGEPWAPWEQERDGEREGEARQQESEEEFSFARGLGRVPPERAETDSEAEAGYQHAWVGHKAPGTPAGPGGAARAGAGAGEGNGEYAAAAPEVDYSTIAVALPPMSSDWAGLSAQQLQQREPQNELLGANQGELLQGESQDESRGEFTSGIAPLASDHPGPSPWDWEPLARASEGAGPSDTDPDQPELEPQGEGHWREDGRSPGEAQEWMQGPAGILAGEPGSGAEGGCASLAAASVPEGSEALPEQGQEQGQGQVHEEEWKQAQSLEQNRGGTHEQDYAGEDHLEQGRWQGQGHLQGQEQEQEQRQGQGQEQEQRQGQGQERERERIQRTETVPESFLWGESEVVPQDWLEWPPQRTPRSISNILPGFTALPTGFDEAEDGGEKDAASLGGVFPLGIPQADHGRMLVPLPGAGSAGGEHGKQPTFVRRFSSARRTRGVRGSAGLRSALRPVLNKVVAPSCSSPLRPTLSEGFSSQAGSEPEVLLPPLGDRTPGAKGRPEGMATEHGPGEGLASGCVPGWQSLGLPGSWLPLTVRSAPQSPEEAPRPSTSRGARIPLSWAEEEERKRSPGKGAPAVQKSPTVHAGESRGAEAGPAWAAGLAQQQEGNLLLGSYDEGTMIRHEEDRRHGWKPGAGKALNLSPSKGEAGRTPSPERSPLGLPPQAKQPLSPPPQMREAAQGPLWVYPFSWEQLFLATNGLSTALRISRKPTFSVYRGRLQDGREVTVKVPSDPGDAAAEARLWAEARALASVRHRNLIELLGVCHAEGTGTGTARGLKGDAPRAQAVVYEYVDGTALNEALAAGSDFALPWAQRHRVALDVAQAIMYLHTGLPELTPHGNVTSSNVMLIKDGLAAKLGGFNAARGSHKKGLPEAQSMAAVEDDIIAFGFLLLELICGQRRHGIREVLPLLRAGRAEEIACPSVRAGCAGHVQFQQLVYTVLTCLDNQQPNSISTINTVMMALSSEPPQWLRPSGVPMRLSQSMDSAQPLHFGPAHAQAQGQPPSAVALHTWAHPMGPLHNPGPLSWEPSDGYESAQSDTERGGAGLHPSLAYPGMPRGVPAGAPVAVPGGAAGGAGPFPAGLGMPSVPQDPQMLAWSHPHGVRYQQQQPPQYQHRASFLQQQQLLQSQPARTFSHHRMAAQLESLDGYWSHSTVEHTEGGRMTSVTESSALAEALSFHSTVQGYPSEAGDSQSQSQSHTHSQRTQSVASMSLHMRKLEQLQQQQQQLLILLLQQQRLSPAVVHQLYGGHAPGAPPLPALPQMGPPPQVQPTGQVPLAPAPEARSHAGGAFWGAFGAHSVAPGAYPAEEQQMPLGPGPGPQHQQDVWRGGLNGTSSRQQSITAGDFQSGGFHGGLAADALDSAGLGLAPQRQGQVGQESNPSNSGSWIAMDQIQEERKQQSLGQGGTQAGGMQEDEQDDAISTCTVHCSSDEEAST